jgi:hypothetical protein
MRGKYLFSCDELKAMQIKGLQRDCYIGVTVKIHKNHAVEELIISRDGGTHCPLEHLPTVARTGVRIFDVIRAGIYREI